MQRFFVQSSGVVTLAALATLTACGHDATQHAESTSALSRSRTVGRLGAAAGSSTLTPPLQRYALLIGIAHYPNPLEDLPGPATDVRSMRSLLVNEYGFSTSNVDTLTDARATRLNIIAGIRRALARAGPQGLVLIYYSGHGLKLDKNYSVQDHEISGVDQALKVWNGDGRATILLDDELGFLLREQRSRHTIVVLDACFSGTGARRFTLDSADTTRRRSRPRFVNKSTDFDPGDPGLSVPTSFLSDGLKPSDPNLASMPYLTLAATEDTSRAFGAGDWPSVGESHSVFTYFLVSALSQPAEHLTARDLIARVSTSAHAALPCNRYDACQLPQIEGEQQDAILVDLLGARQSAIRGSSETTREPHAQYAFRR